MSAKFILLETIDIFGIFPHYQTLLGAFLVLWLIWLFAKRRFNAVSSPKHPTDEEVQAKLSTWHPEPLIAESPAHPSLKPRLISSVSGKRIIVDGKDCLNLGSHNYLGLLGDERIKERATATVQKYGVGSCGPRGFYGTVDVHLELEERLAKFMEAEEAIVYSYGFSTIASAIPAYCKRKDIVFADEKVNFAIQKGLDASRSPIRYFKHNDVEDLERLLMEQAAVDRKDTKKAGKIRRFLIVEGIYINTGLVCPLPELVKLCRKYKLRIFVDESISFGTLGKTGKGVTEYFGVPRHEVDMIMGSLEWAVGSIGGFCVGSTFVIEHQRLSGLGYCFSASLPPLLTAAAIKSLDIMEEDPGVFKKLQDNCLVIQEKLKGLKHFEVSALPESPVKHLFLKNTFARAEEQELLSKISDRCIDNNLAVIQPVYLEAERQLPRPSLRLCASSNFDSDDIEFIFETLEKCSKEILD
ncbi:serine palmitoyltransferase 1 [Microplitis mediator]|uniref:serine palmitoyltransferase 1 n=1 Tax=Microplitis mediator TaxID=375433 RepID=UPI0025559CD4|nr:serine palmitoyltransferase 1 [Microplitis mediator]